VTGAVWLLAAAVGIIDFFGYRGIDIAAVRAALPIHEGAAFDPEHFDDDAATNAVKKVTGHAPTDLGVVCCDSGGNWMLYLGLGGASYHPVAFHPAPTGKASLAPALQRAHDEMMVAWGQAVRKGNSGEDRSRGYSLLEDPAARAKQLAFREVVLREEKNVLTVLATSSNGEQRAMAAEALGYARRSGRQIAALVTAGLDPDAGVRNNATRALVVLVTADPKIGRKIPPGPFLSLLSSGSWEDHNKASLLFEAMTRSRDPQLLRDLRSQALDSLVEMARWRNPGHAIPAKLILGRIAGMDESKLEKMDTETIVAAAEERR
jgi:hypothetical protein